MKDEEKKMEIELSKKTNVHPTIFLRIFFGATICFW